MEETKNLCAQIPLELHAKVCEMKEKLGLTTSQYITNLLRTYFVICQQESKGGATMENSRTMAFQIPEELFQRIKQHLDRESKRLVRKVTQREFVLGLIEEALSKAEAASEGVNTEAGDITEGEAEPEPDQAGSGGDEEADQAE